MQIQQIAIEKIIPYEQNTRKHSAEQINRLAQSITEFGFNQPLVLDDKLIVLCGHGRLLAAVKLGLKDVPVYQIKGLSEAQKRAYRILDNRITEEAGWDIEALESEVELMLADDYDVEGWDLDWFQKEDVTPLVEDETEGIDAKPKTTIRSGDLIQLGGHFVLCGDALDSQNPEKLMQSQKARLVVTDPPYGVNHIGGTKDPRRKTYRTGGEITNDDLDLESIYALVNGVLINAKGHTLPGAAAYIACPPGKPLPVFINAMADTFPFKHSLVWVKHAFVFGRADYHYRHELVLYGWKDDAGHYFTDRRNEDSVFEAPRGDSKVPHPTSKPIGLFGKFIQNSSIENEIILDPFLGSGTSLIASEQLGRRCYGLEISPEYCQVIVDRFRNYRKNQGLDDTVLINGQRISQLHDGTEEKTETRTGGAEAGEVAGT